MNFAAQAIDALARPAVLTRKEEGSYNTDGEWEAGGSVSYSMRAVVQPLKPDALKDMPEGVRACATHTVWSRTKIQLDDVVTVSGVSYRVMLIQDRVEGFTRAVAEMLRDA